MSDLSNENRLRQQRAHSVASVLGSLHMDGLDVDPKAFVIAQRYVDGEIPVDEMMAAMLMRDQLRTKITDTQFK